jgi:hypothetical protein
LCFAADRRRRLDQCDASVAPSQYGNDEAEKIQMSGLVKTHGRVAGVTAAAAVVLSMMPTGAQAAGKGHDLAEAIAIAKGTTGSLSAASSAKVGSLEEDPEIIPSLCTLTSYTPNKIVLGGSTASKTFSLKATGCTLRTWAILVLPFTVDDPDRLDGIAGVWPEETGFHLTRKIPLSPRVLRNADAGKSTVEALAWGNEDPVNTETRFVEPATAAMPFQLLRRSTFGSTFNASPEPVKKGKSISIKGTLARINWNGAKNLKYVGFAKAKAQVQFKANGATKYVTVKTIVAGKGGKFSTKVKATKSGRWRLSFGGLSTTAPATSASDAVKVN